jgi:hypothetical protein
MRPAPIPDDAIWEGARRTVLGPPDNDITGAIAPVETLVDCGDTVPAHRISVRCVLEPGDLERLAAGGCIWLSFYGGMAPMSIDVCGPYERPQPLR